MQDMVDTPKGAASLDCDEIRHMLDHTERALVASLIRANRAEFILGQIPASHASPYGARCFLKRGHQLRQPRGFLHQQVQRDPFRRTISEPWKLLEVLL